MQNDSKWTDRINTAFNGAGIVINCLLLFFVIRAYNSTVVATNAATRATEIADSTFKYSREADKKNAREADSLFNLNSQTAQAQINALKGQVNAMNRAVGELRKQFEIENKPLFGVIELVATNYTAGEKLVVKYNIRNFGKYPVSILSVKFGYKQWLVPDGYRSELAKYPEEPTEMYVVDEFAVRGNFTSHKVIDSTYHFAVTKGPMNLYVFGEIKYINPIDNAPDKYIFCYIVATKKQYGYRQIDSTTTIKN